MQKMMRMTIVTIMVLTAVSTHRPAYAGDLDFSGLSVVFIESFPVVMGLCGLAIALASDGGDGRLSPGAQAFGYVSGGLNIGFGTWMAGLAAKAKSSSLYGVAAATNLALGIADIAVTYYRATRGGPTPPPAKVSLVPFVGADARGQPFAGIGIRGASW